MVIWRVEAACEDGSCKLPTALPDCVTSLLDEEGLQVDWLWQEGFSNAGWREHWIVETQGAQVDANGLGLTIRSPENSSKKLGTTVWFRDALPEDVLIVVQARTLSSAHYNACNLNLFLHAREANGSAYQSGRSGSYPNYHKIPNYIFTFVGGDMSGGWSRARRDPGFQLLSEYDIRSTPGQTYQLILLKVGQRLCYWIDEKIIHDFTDPAPLTGGQFGLRTWASDIIWEEVRLGIISHR